MSDWTLAMRETDPTICWERNAANTYTCILPELSGLVDAESATEWGSSRLRRRRR